MRDNEDTLRQPRGFRAAVRSSQDTEAVKAYVAAPKAGLRLADRYVLTREIGRGGMGVVFQADDPKLGREVAVKMIPPGPFGTAALERFQREARTLAQLDHPGILPIHDFGEHEESLFLVMPLVTGSTLRTLIRERRLLLGETLEISAQLADALDYSHSRAIVHRDVKPENVMLNPDRGGLRARLMDFGLARETSATRLTRSGSLLGTLAYMSPEQVDNQPIDGRADLYALGMVLYECLLGEPAFSGNVGSMLYRIAHEPPLSLRQRGVAVSEALDALVLRCLAKDPRQRVAGGAELANALREIAADLGEDQRTLSVIRSPHVRRAASPPAPFVGREAELAELQARLVKATEGECQLVLVEGDVGSGKSCLLEELERLVTARGIRVLRSSFADLQNAMPFQGFGELFLDYFRHHDSASEPSIPDLSDLAEDLQKLFPFFAESDFLDREKDEETVDEELPGETPEPAQPIDVAWTPELAKMDPKVVFDLLARTLLRLAGGKPLIVLLESLHAGEQSVEALAYVVRRLGLSPTLFVGTYLATEIRRGHPLRDLIAGFEDSPRFCRLTLQPFTAAELRRLVQIELGDGDVDDDVIERIQRATEGNPFFTRELVRSLVESDDLKCDPSGVWRLRKKSGITRHALPETVQQAVKKRLHRLDEKKRDVLAIASILGRGFEYADLEALTQDDEIDEIVDHLIEDGMLVEDRNTRGDHLSFSSVVLSDVLYRELPRRRRRKLHRRHAERLEKRYADRLERVYPQLVHHFAEADVSSKAVRYGRDMARLSLASFSPDEALFAARTALELIDEDEMADALAVRGELLLLVARAECLAGRPDEALYEAEKAAEAFSSLREGTSDESLQETFLDGEVAAALFLAETAWQGLQGTKASYWVGRGLELARKLSVDQDAEGRRSETLRALLNLGATLAHLRGEHLVAQSYLDEAEALRGAADAEPEEDVPEGGTLVTALPNAVRKLNPAEIRSDEESEVVAMIHETLLTTDAQGTLRPQLGKSWNATGDGRGFIVELREDGRFSDGSPLRAEDVKVSFERAARQRSTNLPAALAALEGVDDFLNADNTSDAEGLRGIEVDGERRLIFHLREPLPIFPTLLSQLSMSIVKPIEASGQRLLGTGPFVLGRHDDRGLLLRRNMHYWRGAAHLDAVELRTDLDASGIAAGLRAGMIDLARDLLPNDLEEVLRDPRFRPGLVEATQKNVYLVLFNTASPMMRDPRLRRAMAGVVRVQDLVWRGLGRFAQPAVSLVPPGILGHDPGRRPASMSRDEARSLVGGRGLDEDALALAETGETTILRAAIHPLLQDRYSVLTNALLDEWSAIGVEVVNVTDDNDAYLAAWQDSRNVDLMIGRWIAHYDDPDSLTFALFHSKTGALRHYYSSAEADRLMEEARQEVDSERRQRLYQRLQGLFTREAVVLPLFYDVNYRIASPRVSGLRLLNVPPYVNYTTLGKSDAPVDAEAMRSRVGDEARWGGEVHAAIRQPLATLDPLASSTDDAAEVVGNVFETLVVEDGARIAPWLAESFEMRHGGRELYLRLRHDVHFHDGRRLTARDVRYSFERNLREGTTAAHFPLLPVRGAGDLRDGRAAGLAGCRILSTHEVVLELAEPMSFFPALLACGTTAVMPDGSRSFDGSWRDGCVGTGPFRVVRCAPSGRVELERNPEYWRRGHPRSQRLFFHPVATPGEVAEAFREGRLTLASNLLPGDHEAMCRTPKLMAGYRETARLATGFLVFNTRREAFADIGARRDFVDAFYAEVDHAARESLGRSLVRAKGFLPPGLLDHEAAEPTPAPPSRGGELWAGRPLRVVADPAYTTHLGELWTRLCKTWRDAGVVLHEVSAPTVAKAFEAVRDGGVDLAALRWSASYPDADGFVATALDVGGLLHDFCGSAVLDRLIAAGRREREPALRHTIYREIEEMLTREALLLPLFHEQAYRFCRPGVDGLRLKLTPPEVRYDELFARR